MGLVLAWTQEETTLSYWPYEPLGGLAEREKSLPGQTQPKGGRVALKMGAGVDRRLTQRLLAALLMGGWGRGGSQVKFIITGREQESSVVLKGKWRSRSKNMW